jgi:glycosyltransferase involved in cell wall biosynthesis
VRVVNYHPRARVGDGGVTNSVRRLSEALSRAGADAVIAYDGTGTPQREAGVEWWPVPHGGRGPARVPAPTGRVLASADVLILNSAWTASNISAGRAARRFRVPYVVAPRGAYDPLILRRRSLSKRVWWSLFERRLVASAAAVHVFFAVQQQHLAALGYTGPFVVAPNGVSLPDALPWDGGSGGYLLYLGRLDPEHKGLDLLLRAFALLPGEERPNLRLHGPDWRGGRAQLDELVRRLGLGRHVQIGRPVYGTEKAELLARAKGFVYPSRWEGFGNSLAEAAGVGLPALATPYPLARELEARGACLVVDPEVRALADGLRRLIAAPPATASAAAEITADFSWDAVAQRWLEQLESIAGHGRGYGQRWPGADDER